jgi:hypothetical protein
MMRLSIACVVLAAGLASAQDMPLHEILKAGEGWKVFEGEMPPHVSGGYSVDVKNKAILLEGKPIEHSVKEPTACVVALGGAQLFVADASDRYIWSFRILKNGELGPGDRYCRMRVLGDARLKGEKPEKFLADPSAMTMDGANRTYVATSLGIQSFDPTGRLNGVFTAPPGRVTELAFDGNKLFAKAEGKVYVRVMLAEGVKR